MVRQIDDSEGALYKNDVVKVIEWTDVAKKSDDDTLVVFVSDEIGKHHTVGLRDIELL